MYKYPENLHLHLHTFVFYNPIIINSIASKIYNKKLISSKELIRDTEHSGPIEGRKDYELLCVKSYGWIFFSSHLQIYNRKSTINFNNLTKTDILAFKSALTIA